MSKEATPSHGVMEGKGASNRHAKLPAGGASLAIPLLEAAVRKIELGDDDHAIVIADYGSSGQELDDPHASRSCGFAATHWTRPTNFDFPHRPAVQ
jgi:hypothetical protein